MTSMIMMYLNGYGGPAKDEKKNRAYVHYVTQYLDIVPAELLLAKSEEGT